MSRSKKPPDQSAFEGYVFQDLDEICADILPIGQVLKLFLPLVVNSHLIEEKKAADLAFPNDSSRELRNAINRAAQKINAKCAVCGDSAKPESHGGWWGTLCAYHNIAARQARGDTRDRHELWAVPLTPADVSGER